MLLRCMSRFDVEREYDDLSAESLNQDERAEADEKAEAKIRQYAPKPISDGEDTDEAEEVADDDDDDDANMREDGDDSGDLPLPTVEMIGSSQRPHRDRKRLRDDDEYVYTKRSK